MGEEGFVVLPLSEIDKYIHTAYVTKNADGTVRHYHVHITPPPDVALKGNENAPDQDVSEWFQTFS